MERDEICKVLFTIIDNILNNCIYSNFSKKNAKYSSSNLLLFL